MSGVEAFVHRFEPGSGRATLLLLHGTGGDEHQLIDLGRQLAPEAALLSPRGQVLEDGVAPRFFARRGVGDLDLDDLRRRGEELAAWVRDACVHYERDPASRDRARLLERRQHRGGAAVPAPGHPARRRAAAPDADLPPRRIRSPFRAPRC